jgi:hypothetical protein
MAKAIEYVAAWIQNNGCKCREGEAQEGREKSAACRRLHWLADVRAPGELISQETHY